MEHLEKLDEVWSVFERLLNEDGVLVIAVPNCASCDARIYGKEWAPYDVPRHLWHFTLDTMRAEGECHAGLGNFREIDVEDLTKHKTDSEQMIVGEEAVSVVNKAKDMSRNVCAVGTTVMRAIESTVNTYGRIKPFDGWTNKFIFPPYNFTVANSMISNFHMPLSTLLMLQAAFGGYDEVMHEQSPDINRGVEREDPMNQGAGDQGMMFGYATNETENYMPLSLDLAHRILYVLAEIRREGKQMTYLRPDAKSQVTIEYDDNDKPVRIDTIVVSTQHDEFVLPKDDSREAQLKADEEMLAKIRKDVIEILMPRVLESISLEKVRKLFDDNIKYFVNPTGKFVIGGPHGERV